MRAVVAARTSFPDLPMQEQRRASLALKAAGWISTPFLYALMLGIVIHAARRPSAGP